jgi:hypothetical protein
MPSNETGNYNIVIGNNCDVNGSNYDNNIIIGNNLVSSATDSMFITPQNLTVVPQIGPDISLMTINNTTGRCAIIQKQATPTTLADVITILQTANLCL